MTATLIVDFSQRDGVTLRYADGAETIGPLAPPLSADDLADLRWYVEERVELPAAASARGSAIERRLAGWGNALNAQLSGEQHARWLTACRQAGEGSLRLCAASSPGPAPMHWPWVLLTARGAPLEGVDLSVVRQFGADQGATVHTVEELRVLSLVARPDGMPFLAPWETTDAIIEAVEALPVSLNAVRPGTLRALWSALQAAVDAGRPYGLLHLDCHGRPGAVCLESRNGAPDWVSIESLSALLAPFGLAGAVLEACQTASAAPSTWAPQLSDAVGSVFAMWFAAHVDMTRTWTRALLRAIGEGVPPAQAAATAIRAVREAPDRRGRRVGRLARIEDWFVPRLFTAGAARRLRVSGPVQPTAADPPALPRPAGDRLIGRGQALHRLDGMLARQRLVVLAGGAGSGKTVVMAALARRWLATDAIDRVVWLDCETIPRNQVQGRFEAAAEGTLRTLIVVDSLPRTAEARVFAVATIEGAPIHVALISRQPAGADLVLDGLSLEAATQLLTRLAPSMGGRVTEAERLVRALGGLPQAIVQCAPLVAADPTIASEQVYRALRMDPGGPVAATVKLAIEHLDAQVRAILPSLAQCAGGVLASALPFVIDRSPTETRSICRVVAEAGLLRRSAKGHLLWPHPLLAEFVARPSEAALGRFVRAMCALCAAIDERLSSAEPAGGLLALQVSEPSLRRALAVAAPTDHDAIGALTQTLAIGLRLLGRPSDAAALLEQVVAAGPDARTTLTGRMAMQVWQQQGRRQPEAARANLVDMLARLRAHRTRPAGSQRAAATGEEEPARVAALRREVPVLMALMRIEKRCGVAQAELRARSDEVLRMMTAAAELGEPFERLRPVALGDRANLLMDAHEIDEALTVAQEALALYHAVGDSRGIALTVGQVGQLFEAGGALRAAEEMYRDALERLEGIGDVETLAIMEQSLGSVLAELGRAPEAMTHYRRALAAFEQAGDQEGQGQVLNSLGNVDYRANRLSAAIPWYEASRQLGVEINDTALQATAVANLCAVRTQLSETMTDADAAQALLQQVAQDERWVLADAAQCGRPADVAAAEQNLADTLRRLDRLDEACALARSALRRRTAIGHPSTWRSLALLAAIAEAQGDAAEAETLWARAAAVRERVSALR